jgi:glycine oxidase
MLADLGLESPVALHAFASASARMHPEFVHQLQNESGIDPDLRDHGTLQFSANDPETAPPGGSLSGPLPAPLVALEPALAKLPWPATFLKERSVDPRALAAAALKTAKHRGVDISSGSMVTRILSANGRVQGAVTEKSEYRSGIVVNCAGAWAGQIEPLPTRPVKGQMLSVVGVPRDLLRHVVRTPEVYLVPRSDGRILIGATVEEAGYDKRTVPETIQRMHQAAIRTLPALAHARILEDWAGLRPGTPDDLPILGATAIHGYFAATGHFRDGILLAPLTARVMAQLISGDTPEQDLSAFSPARFSA